MPSESILKDALTAYLQPLLKKHEANTLVEFEDLTASWKAADAVLKRSSAADDAVKQVSDLHKSQLQAYQKAAKEALSSWATNDFVLPTRQAKEVADTYSYRCVEAATVQRPLWKVPATALENCLIKVVQHRAAAQTEETVEEGEELDEDTDTIDAKEDDDEVGEEEGEEDEEEEGEVEEDEMGEDDGEAIVETPTGEESDKVNEAAMKAALTNRKRVLLAKKKGQADGKAKQAPKKKIVLAKVGASTASSGTKQGARRKNAPRRGGRSGGRAKGNS